jgi:cation transport protein ChaC
MRQGEGRRTIAIDLHFRYQRRAATRRPPVGVWNMQEFWVFGYGSLMWRPGFAYRERRHALLRGLHRQLCIYSHVHRGSPERPGLVMGLDRGGACRGIAYCIEERYWADTITYLRAREQVTGVYIESLRKICLLGEEPRDVEALAYVVDRAHAQYAGRLSLDEQLRHVREASGQSGRCIDYVRSTAEHLAEMGITDSRLEALVRALDGDPATAARG